MSTTLRDVLVVTAVPAERDAVVRGITEWLEWLAPQNGTEGTDVDSGAPQGAVEASGEAPSPVETLRLAGGYEVHRVRVPVPTPTRGTRSVAPSGRCVDVVAVGAGSAAAAAGTATVLTAAGAAREAGGSTLGPQYGLVVSAGIGGGFLPDTTTTDVPRTAVGGHEESSGGPEEPQREAAGTTAPALSLGGVVVSRTIVAADLGAQTADDGFTSVETLGFGVSTHHSPTELATATAAAVGGVLGTVLTVSTATGTRERARALKARHPGARAEGMEGFGVAEAAVHHDVPVLEIRTISNAVGPRDREAWSIPQALTALHAVFRDGGEALWGA